MSVYECSRCGCIQDIDYHDGVEDPQDEFGIMCMGCYVNQTEEVNDASNDD